MTGAELQLLLLQGCCRGRGKFSFSFTYDGKKSKNESVTPPQVDAAGNKTFFFLFLILSGRQSALVRSKCDVTSVAKNQQLKIGGHCCE